MNTKNFVWLGVGALVIILGFVFLGGDAEEVVEETDVVEEVDVVEDTDVVGEAESAGNEVSVAGVYEEYSPEKLALAEDGDVVLFFHASWCPSCRGLDADIKENLGAIPADLGILKIDYDNSTDMKKKYGVTTQHTFVQVDENGEMIDKWSGSSTLARLVDKVN